MTLVSADPAIARAHFLKAPFTLKHGLAGHPLFSLPRLVELAKSMPRDRIEYNSGKVAIGVKPEDVPKIDRPAEDVIAAIETANAWMVIKMVEHDPEYRALLEGFVSEANLVAGRKADDYSDLQGFIFVSSANATTPFHVDAEENILIQIRGDKFVRTFDNADRSLIQESLAKEISRALTTLTERESDIVRLFFGIGCQEMTLEEIGERFGLTRERVRQIKEKAIRRLRHTSRSKLLKTYLG